MSAKITIAIPLLGILLAGGVVLAQESATSRDSVSEGPKITFPIAELGNCASKDECKAYCDDPTHVDACLSFASSHKLMKSGDVEKARKLAVMKGPGGCEGLACKAYCNDSEHADECIAFAQEHKLISAKDVRIAQVIKSGGGPGGCDSMSACWNYCSDAAHGDECSRFARDNGLEPPRPHLPSGVPSREQIDQKVDREGPRIDKEKARHILSEKSGPGGCKTMDECKDYCEADGHMDACMRFAQENGLMSLDDVARAKKFVNQPGPGGCRGNACRAYCEDESHADECAAFAVEHGFMSKEEAAHVKKFHNIKGPGGCAGEACKTYCEDQSHREECVAFAIQNGFMTQAEADRMKSIQQKMTGPGGCRGEECRGRDHDSPRVEDKQFPDDERQSDEGKRGPTRMTGHGGCKSRAECEDFCKNNPDQCKGAPEGARDESAAQGDQRSGRPESFDAARNRPLQLPANMTSEMQKRYEQYRQNAQNASTEVDPNQYRQYQQYQGRYEGQQERPPRPYPDQPVPSDMPYQEYHQGQYPQAPSAPPAGGDFQGASPPSMPPPPPPPTPAGAPTSLGSYNLIASVFYIFSQLTRGL